MESNVNQSKKSGTLLFCKKFYYVRKTGKAWKKQYKSKLILLKINSNSLLSQALVQRPHFQIFCF